MQSRAGPQKDGKNVNSIPVSMDSKEGNPSLSRREEETVPIPDRWGYLESEDKQSYETIDLERHGKENEFMLGRDQFPQFPECMRISRQHIRLFTLVKDGVEEAWIENNSQNGTRLNSEKIWMKAGEKRKIGDGTKITIVDPYKSYPRISFTFKREYSEHNPNPNPIDKVLHVFWHIESCPPPPNRLEVDVVKEIKDKMLEGFQQEYKQSALPQYTVQVQAYYANRWAKTNTNCLNHLQNAGVKPEPSYSNKPDVAKIKMMADIAGKGKAGKGKAALGKAPIGIITGNSGFVNTLSALRNNGISIYVITSKPTLYEQFKVVGIWPSYRPPPGLTLPSITPPGRTPPNPRNLPHKALNLYPAKYTKGWKFSKKIYVSKGEIKTQKGQESGTVDVGLPLKQDVVYQYGTTDVFFMKGHVEYKPFKVGDKVIVRYYKCCKAGKIDHKAISVKQASWVEEKTSLEAKFAQILNLQIPN
eukprot:jgi/Bigna1/70115/fgenesh1_pg.11_\